MEPLSFYQEDATIYDSFSKDHNLLGSEVLFGLLYEFIASGETLLDIGVVLCQF